MKTHVCISIDTEFSVAGTFKDTVKHTPVAERAVECESNGESHGLGFLLGTFKKYNIKATFFIETLNTHYFGIAPLKNIAEKIVADQQDIQLHLHPVWTYFKNENWKDELKTDNVPNDDMSGRNIDELCELMQHGISTFAKLGIPRPIALRTGNLNVDTNVYRAMKETGFSLASNVGVAISEPPPSLRWLNGRHQLYDITELPVFSYYDVKFKTYVHEKCLTITGTSFAEMKYILLRARQLNIGEVIILTHPSEFVKCVNTEYTTMFPNYLNQQRLVKLCRFLNENSDKFEVTTFGEAKTQWMRSEAKERAVRVPIASTITRIFQNKVNDLFCKY